MEAARQLGNEKKGQLVTFRLGKEFFGIDIFKIQEVLHLQKITSIPNAPAFVEGVIELRNRVIPVIDLKKRLNIAETDGGKKRIVILDLDDRSIGIIVDDISKVLHLDEDRFEETPDAVLSDLATNCISKLAKSGDDLIIIISPEQILTKREHEEISRIEAN